MNTISPSIVEQRAQACLDYCRSLRRPLTHNERVAFLPVVELFDKLPHDMEDGELEIFYELLCELRRIVQPDPAVGPKALRNLEGRVTDITKGRLTKVGLFEGITLGTQSSARYIRDRVKLAVELASGAEATLADLFDTGDWRKLGYATWEEFFQTELPGVFRLTRSLQRERERSNSGWARPRPDGISEEDGEGAPALGRRALLLPAC